MITTSSSRSKFKVSWDVKPRWKGKGKKFNILGGKEAMKTDEKYTKLLAFKPQTRKEVKQGLVLATFPIAGWYEHGLKLNHHVTEKSGY